MGVLIRYLLVLGCVACLCLNCQVQSNAELVAECPKVCAKLEECGLLPSLFGAGSTPKQNCIDRCTQTPLEGGAGASTAQPEGEPEEQASALERLQICLAEADAVDSEAADGDGARKLFPCSTTCKSFSSCIDLHFTSPAAIGLVSGYLQALPIDSPASVPGACLPIGSSGSTAGAPPQPCGGSLANATFAFLGTLTPSTGNGAATYTCDEVFASRFPLGTLPPGPYGPMVEVRSVADERLRCRVVRGGTQIGKPGSEHTYTVQVPQDLFGSDTDTLEPAGLEECTDAMDERPCWADCEGLDADASCQSGTDDDGDGSIDCAEGLCASYCAEHGLLPSGNESEEQ